MSSTSAVKESRASAYHWQSCLLVRIEWSISLVIIYIKKIIVKALDFNDIIKKIMGMSAQ